MSGDVPQGKHPGPCQPGLSDERAQVRAAASAESGPAEGRTATSAANHGESGTLDGALDASEINAVTADAGKHAELDKADGAAEERRANDSDSPATDEKTEEAAEGFAAELRSRLINLTDLRHPTRLLAGIAFVLLLAGAAMIWQQRLFGERLLTVEANGAQVQVAGSVLVVGSLLLVAAWTFLIVAVTFAPSGSDAKAERQHRLLRRVALGAYSLFVISQVADVSRVFGYFILFFLFWVFTNRWWRRWTYRAAFTVFLIAVSTYVVIASGWPSSALLLVALIWLLPPRHRASSSLRSLLFVLSVFIIVGGSEVFFWLTLGVHRAAGQMLGWLDWIAFFILSPVLILVGTEFADLGAAFGKSVAEKVTGYRALTITLGTALLDVALAVTFFSWRVVVSMICVLGFTAALGVLVYRVRAFPPRDLAPLPAYVLVALAFGLAIFLSFLTYLGDVESWAAIGLLTSIGLGIAAIGPASLTEKAQPRPASRFVTLAALSAVGVSAITAVLIHFTIPVNFTSIAWGSAAVIGAATLIAVAWILFVRREPLDKLTPVLRQLFAVNVGSSVLALIAIVLAKASAAGERLSEWQAAVIVVALAWDIATSGAHTNKEGTTLSRESRILLFLAYALTVMCGVLLLRRSLVITVPAAWPPPFDSEMLTRSGLLLLGFPLLIFLLLPELATALAALPQPVRNTVKLRIRVGRNGSLVAPPPERRRHPVRRLGSAVRALVFLSGIMAIIIGPNLVLLHFLSAGQGAAPSNWQDAVSQNGSFEVRFPAGWSWTPTSDSHLVDAYGPEVGARQIRAHLYVEQVPSFGEGSLGPGAACAEAQVRDSRLPAGRAKSFQCWLSRGAERAIFLYEYLISKGIDRYALVIMTPGPDIPGQLVIQEIGRSFTFILWNTGGSVRQVGRL